MSRPKYEIHGQANSVGNWEAFLEGLFGIQRVKSHSRLMTYFVYLAYCYQQTMSHNVEKTTENYVTW